MAEVKRTTVIAALHRHDLLAPRKAARRRQRHHVGFRAGIGEADKVKVKAFGNGFRKNHFAGMMRPQIKPLRQGIADRLVDARVRVPIDASRILPHQIKIGMPVNVPDRGSLCPLRPDGKWRRIQNRARIAARHHGLRPLMQCCRFRALDHKVGNSFVKGVINCRHSLGSNALSNCRLHIIEGLASLLQSMLPRAPGGPTDSCRECRWRQVRAPFDANTRHSSPNARKPVRASMQSHPA